MRKWMRDRNKRRKKPGTTPEEAGQDKPAPLQPTFLDRNDYEAPDDIGNRADDRPAAEAPQPVYESQPETEPEPTTEAPARPQGDRARRERSRRRGRRGRGSKSAQPGGDRPRPSLPINPGQATGEAAEVGFDGAAGADAPTVTPAPEEKPAQRQQKTPKGAVVLAIGLPGSGKSSWFKRHNIIPLSSDLVRGLLFDDATEQRHQDLVFSSLRTLLRARMLAGRPWNYIDATNLSPKERHSWIKMAHDFGYEAQAVFFDVPTEVCMERNRRRERNVPDEVMLRMAAKLRPPKFEEGFTKMTVVRVKKSATQDSGEPPQDGQGESEE
jgi:predicted kinase